MPKEKVYTLQIRIGPRTSASIRKWLHNQDNPNESARQILEHFTRLYGYADIASDQVQIGMAKDLLIAKGETIQPDLLIDTPQKYVKNIDGNKEKHEEMTIQKAVEIVTEEEGKEEKTESGKDLKTDKNEIKIPGDSTELNKGKQIEKEDVIPVIGKRNIKL